MTRPRAGSWTRAGPGPGRRGQRHPRLCQGRGLSCAVCGRLGHGGPWQGDIALYLLYRDAAPEKAVEDYKSAIAQLKDLARGVVALQAAGVAAPVADGGGTVLLDGSGRTFTGDS
jgi:hypothetical protein